MRPIYLLSQTIYAVCREFDALAATRQTCMSHIILIRSKMLISIRLTQYEPWIRIKRPEILWANSWITKGFKQCERFDRLDSAMLALLPGRRLKSRESWGRETAFVIRSLICRHLQPHHISRRYTASGLIFPLIWRHVDRYLTPVIARQMYKCK